MFGVSISTALDHKPYHLRSIRPPHAMKRRRLERDALALRLYAEGATREEIAEATGRSLTTTRRFLRSVAQGGTGRA